MLNSFICSTGKVLTKDSKPFVTLTQGRGCGSTGGSFPKNQFDETKSRADPSLSLRVTKMQKDTSINKHDETYRYT